MAARMLTKSAHAVLPVALFLCMATAAFAATAVADLRCDYAVNPLGVDSANPRLFWKLESGARGQRQTSYQILAASSEKIWHMTTAICGTAARWIRMKQFKFPTPARC